MAIKFLGNESAGTPLNAGETRSVVVTEEALVPADGYEGDEVVYSATIKNDLGAALPDTFLVNVQFDGVVVEAGLFLDAGNYNPATFEFSVDVIIPAIAVPEAKTVNLAWAEQEI